MEEGCMNNKPILFFNAYKKVISRLFLIMALWFILGDASWAGPYILVMSKNKALCESMLGLYNKDMDTYGRIDYDSHERFSRIDWENINENEDDVISSLTRAKFDINNDGKNEIVVKFSGPVLAVNVDTLLIYPEGSEIFSKDPETGKRGRLLNTSNILFGGNNNQSYYLKQVPKLLQEEDLTYKLKHLPKYLKKVNIKVLRKNLAKAYIGPSYVLQPFIWHGTTYISMTDRNPEWIVVGKYKQAKEVQDICYFYDQSHRFINY